MSLYDLLFFGCRNRATLDAFVGVIGDLIAESGVKKNEVRLLKSSSGYLKMRNPRTPTVVACFSDPSANEIAVITSLLAARVPIIPIARETERFEDFPALLQPLNGAVLPDDRNRWTSTAIAVLESIGLLRAQRRLFISYRRTESQAVAVQLHDALSARGFHVFLDTHSIRPGKLFQDNLWHSLCDSDVMVMLDTATYFRSKWTREEFGRAQSMGINILRIVWPGHTPERTSELSEQFALNQSDSQSDLLRSQVLEEIIEKVEWLRARGVAARHNEITGKLKTGVEAIGGEITGSGAYRSVSIRLKDGGAAWAYPVIGVPTAKLMHNIARWSRIAKQSGPYFVYDHTGISASWLEHIDWLDESISEVDCMRVSDTAAVLSRRLVS
ncbi:MAG: toll/interleukin-1 receptor domain-containing protein [Rhodobacteraceae bacterium]|nr:toll/interleukin-1 receptor domain-containing protein [Paracoccaceae bacterium]